MERRKKRKTDRQERKRLKKQKAANLIHIGQISHGPSSNLYYSILKNGKPAVPTDVTLYVGKSRKCIPAHKFMLSLHAEMCLLMFGGGFSEAKSDEAVLSLEGLIAGNDPNCETFLQFLGFIYGVDINCEDKQLAALYQLADFFQIRELAGKVKTQLHRYSKKHGNFELLEQLESLKLSEVFDSCVTRISQQFAVLEAFPGFMSPQTLIRLLQNKYLQVEEIELFRGVVKWITARSEAENDMKIGCENQMEESKKVMSHVRIACIPTKYLAQFVAPLGLIEQSVLTEAFVFQGGGLGKKDGVRFKRRFPVPKSESVDVSKRSQQ